LRPTSSLRVAAVVLALLVHATTVFLVAMGVLVLFAPTWWVFRVLAAGILIGLAWEVRPRLGSAPDAGDKHLLSRQEAPAAWTLIDRIAATIGARPPRWLLLSPQVNASYSRPGLGSGAVLTLGVPLWVALSCEERLALLGHELGHDRNGDLREGRLAWTAANTLSQWAGVLPIFDVWRTAPTLEGRAGAIRTTRFGSRLVVALVLLPLTVTIGVVGGCLRGRLSRSGQRAEYLADDIGAQLAGTPAMLSVLDVLLVADGLVGATRGARLAGSNPWAAARDYRQEVAAIDGPSSRSSCVRRISRRPRSQLTRC